MPCLPIAERAVQWVGWLIALPAVCETLLALQQRPSRVNDGVPRVAVWVASTDVVVPRVGLERGKIAGMRLFARRALVIPILLACPALARTKPANFAAAGCEVIFTALLQAQASFQIFIQLLEVCVIGRQGVALGAAGLQRRDLAVEAREVASTANFVHDVFVDHTIQLRALALANATLLGGICDLQDILEGAVGALVKSITHAGLAGRVARDACAAPIGLPHEEGFVAGGNALAVDGMLG